MIKLQNFKQPDFTRHTDVTAGLVISVWYLF